jgi:hypothetical protein
MLIPFYISERLHYFGQVLEAMNACDFEIYGIQNYFYFVHIILLFLLSLDEIGISCGSIINLVLCLPCQIIPRFLIDLVLCQCIKVNTFVLSTPAGNTCRDISPIFEWTVALKNDISSTTAYCLPQVFEAMANMYSEKICVADFRHIVTGDS